MKKDIKAKAKLARQGLLQTETPQRAAYELGDEQRRQMHALLKSLLAEVDRLCRREGLAYVLIFDTLWGALCGRDFRADAYSASLALPRADYERLLLLLAGPQRHPRYSLELPGGEEGSIRCAARLCCQNTRLRRKACSALHSSESPIALYLYPLDGVAGDDAPQLRRLRRVCAWNAALRRRLLPAMASARADAEQALPPALAPTPAEIYLKSLLPSAWSLRLRERLMRGARRSRTDVLVIYAAMDGLLPACYFEKAQLFPSSGILFGKKNYACPAKAHELLSALYGDYRCAELQNPPSPPLYESFFIDAAYWADILYAEHPEDVL